jgi:hypothetical protein
MAVRVFRRRGLFLPSQVMRIFEGSAERFPKDVFEQGLSVGSHESSEFRGRQRVSPVVLGRSFRHHHILIRLYTPDKKKPQHCSTDARASVLRRARGYGPGEYRTPSIKRVGWIRVPTRHLCFAISKSSHASIRSRRILSTIALCRPSLQSASITSRSISNL